VAAAAAVSPESEAEPLEAARTCTVAEVKERCRRVRATAGADEGEAYDRIRRGRYLRSWTDPEGALRLEARLTPDGGATVLAGLAPHQDRMFSEARKEGRREPREAYAADALVALAQAGSGSGSGSGSASGPRAMVHVRVDHSALLRGHAEPGEVCDIPGIGPIPAGVARSLASDSILKVLLTDGADIKAVVHYGRTIPARIRTALEARDPVCVVPGCDVRVGLEIDHIVPFKEDGPTSLDNLARLCSWDHHLKTNCGYRLGGGPGAWTWSGPDPPDP